MQPVSRTALIVSIGACGLMFTPRVNADELAFTTSNPLFPSSSFDGLQVGEPGGFSGVSLRSGLEFLWDIDYNAASDRFYVIGAGDDAGESPPGREFNFNNTGTIWSFDRDGSNAVQHASGLDRPLHLDVTPDGQTVFFAEQGEGQGDTFANNGRIGRLDVATNSIQTVDTAPTNAGPTGVDFDPVTGDLFYQANNRGTDISMQQIRRVRGALTAADLSAGSDALWLDNPVPADGTLDDGGEFTVLSAGRNVAVHDGFVYFTYRNRNFTPNSEIRRLPLDFDFDSDDPENFETLVGGIRIIDFEIAGDTLYWTDPQQNGLFSVALGEDGLPVGDPNRVATGDPSFASLPIGVAVVPEPTSVAVLLLGSSTLLMARRRRVKR